MTKTEYREYLASPYWQNRRKEFLECVEGCAKCKIPRWLAAICYDQDLHVHHVSYAHLHAELNEDLQALCRRCHEIETFGKSSLRPPWSEECSVCDNPCFNPYSLFGQCSDCSGVEFWSVDVARFTHFSAVVLRDIYRRIGLEQILDGLATIEQQEKQDDIQFGK